MRTTSSVKGCRGCEFYRTVYGQLDCRHPVWRRRSEQEKQAILAGTHVCGYDTRGQRPILAPDELPAWRDPKTGKVYAVSCGFSRGRNWYTACVQVRGGRPRFTSPALPVRYTRGEAVEDLRTYAHARGWEEVRRDGAS